MRHSPSLVTALLAVSAITVPSAGGPTSPAKAELERRFDALIHPDELSGWMKSMAALPNHVGSAHDKANAEMLRARLESWGWETHLETFQVLYPTPIRETLELLGPTTFQATLQEPPVPGDDSSARTADALPAYGVFQGDGDVTAPLVYVNYGMPEDYEALARMGSAAKGAIVIARYGHGARSVKARLAQEHGAVGCIFYSDPYDDGFSVDDPYPKGSARPPQGLQRGEVADRLLYPGDPLTPGVGATRGAKRLKREDAPTILKIPALPISWADAQHFLGALRGRVVPPSWRGSVPVTYHVGSDGTARAHLAVRSEWSLKPIYDVVAVMKGSRYPDQWVLRGNHHDAWVFGATDPMSSLVALMAEAKAIGQLVRQGWRPKRTLVYLSWDGEEAAMLGSTEWAEAHAEELKKKGVIYINSDTNARGLLEVEGSHAFQHFVNQTAADVTDPETGVPVTARKRAALEVAGTLLDARHDLPLSPLGGGSDYTSFLQHLGVPALDVGYRGEGESFGVYHSAYDTWEHHSRFVDPGFVYDALLAKTVGRLVLRLADADLPVQRYGDFAEAVAGYLAEVKRLADDKRAEQEAQARLIAAGAYRLADDPTKPSGAVTPRKPVPHFNFVPLDSAIDRLKASARAYDAALGARGAVLTAARRAQLFELTRDAEQALVSDVGLPGRPWYKHLIYAPGRLTGYEAKTLPGVREAIEEERWADVDRYAVLTARALEAYADRLDAGTRLIGRD
jgi:N-acetylated-alpha-linked acidic dipeptidase